jgi:hypothetical protein
LFAPMQPEWKLVQIVIAVEHQKPWFGRAQPEV